MNKVCCIIILLVCVVLSNGCEEQEKDARYSEKDYVADFMWANHEIETAMEILEDYDLIGDHELEKMEVVNSSSLTLDGKWYFLGGGKLKGEGYSGEHLKFTWRSNDKIVISQLPVSVLQINIKDVEIPFIHFKWDLPSMEQDRNFNTIPDFGAANKYMNGKCLSVATVTISQKDFDKEIWLYSSIGR